MSQNTIAPRERAPQNTPRTGVGLGVTKLYTSFRNQNKMQRYGLSILQRQDDSCIKPDSSKRKSIQKYIYSIQLADQIMFGTSI